MSIGEKTSGGSSWSRDDDIAFEKALAIYADETENRWEKIAGFVHGKTLCMKNKQMYKEKKNPHPLLEKK